MSVRLEIPRPRCGVDNFSVFARVLDDTRFVVSGLVDGSEDEVVLTVRDPKTVVYPLAESDWTHGELTRVLCIWPLLDRGWIPNRAFLNLFDSRLDFLQGASDLEILIWVLWPIFRRIRSCRRSRSELLKAEGPVFPGVGYLLEKLFAAESVMSEAFPPHFFAGVHRLDEVEEDEPLEPEYLYSGTIPVRWTRGWNRASKGGPVASGAEYEEMMRTARFGVLSGNGDWVLTPRLPGELEVSSESRRDLIRSMASWLNRAQLGTEYSHTGTVAHARIMLNVLFRESPVVGPGEEFVVSDKRADELFVNSGLGIRRTADRWCMSGSMIRFVTNIGHDETYGVGEYARNADLRHIRSFVQMCMGNPLLVVEVLAIEPNLYNPFLVSGDAVMRFLQTRADMLLSVLDPVLGEVRVILVEFKMLMACGSVHSRVKQSGPLKQAVANTFLLAACTGILVSHVLVWFSTPVVAPEVRSGVAFAYMVDMGHTWQSRMYERLATYPFGGDRLVYADTTYLIAGSPTRLGEETVPFLPIEDGISWRDLLPRMELTGLITGVTHADAPVLTRPRANPTLVDLFARDLQGVPRVTVAAPYGFRVELSIVNRANVARVVNGLIVYVAQAPALEGRPRAQVRLFNSSLFRASPILRIVGGGPTDETGNHRILRAALFEQTRVAADRVCENREVLKVLQRVTIRNLFKQTSSAVPEFARYFRGDAHQIQRPPPKDSTETIHRLVNRLVNHHVMKLFADPFSNIDYDVYTESLYHHNSCRRFWADSTLSLRKLERVIIPYVVEQAISIVISF